MLSLLLFSCTTEPQLGDAPKMRFEGVRTFDDFVEQGIALAPKWVQADLRLQLAHLDETMQNDLMMLLVDQDDPYLLDEIAFTIAHLSPEVLLHNSFYPQIITENAQLIYQRDEQLSYVRIIDEGVPGEDENYYTTTAYIIEDEDGNQSEKIIDRDIYYWYLVHPRMEDELPFYIDAWEPCGNSVTGYSSECPTTPELGTFWRSFLWDGADDECPDDRECPIIEDYVTEESVMWKSKAYDSGDNGAIGAIIRWQKASMNFGAGNERPIQPNRIYAVGCGNCGEWSDMATAAARSSLIPSQNVGARGNDHVWNEFWDDDWMQWEPVNNYVLHWYYYISQEGETKLNNPLYAITSSRGDGFVSTDRTVDYANTFELDVFVHDEAGTPVDGAVVSLFGPIVVYDRDGYWYVGEAYSGADGHAHFTLGESNEYLFRVDSPLGSNPSQTDRITPFLSDTVAGDDQTFEIELPFTLPTFNPAQAPALDNHDEELEVKLNLTHRLMADGYFLRGSMSEYSPSGKVDLLVLDADNYALYFAGEAYEAQYSLSEIDELNTTVSLSSEKRWYLVVSNKRSVGIASIGDISISLSSELFESKSMSSNLVLLPTEEVVVQITPAP